MTTRGSAVATAFHVVTVAFASASVTLIPTEASAQQPVVKRPAAFERRCIPPDCVVRRLNMPNMRPSHALSGGRIAALGATRGFHHGLSRPTVDGRTSGRGGSGQDRSRRVGLFPGNPGPRQ